LRHLDLVRLAGDQSKVGLEEGQEGLVAGGIGAGRGGGAAAPRRCNAEMAGCMTASYHPNQTKPERVQSTDQHKKVIVP